MTAALEPHNDLWPDPRSTCRVNVLAKRNWQRSLRKGTDLELQHVTGVVMDADAQCVNIWGVRATPALILFVPNNVSCHATGGFVECCNTVAIIIGVEAPGSLFNAAGLKQEPTNQNVIALHLFQLSEKIKVPVGPDLPDAASGLALGLISIVLRIAVKSLVILWSLAPLDQVAFS